MFNKIANTFPGVVLALILSAGPAAACSWAAFATGNCAVVARTVDWYSNDSAKPKGVGRGVAQKTSDTANGREYTTKYASIQLECFGFMGGEGMNEKGLQGSMLFLEGSALPPAQPGRTDLNPFALIPYALGNFASVKELVDSLDGFNFTPTKMNLPAPEGGVIQHPPENFPGHFAFADATGDRAIIEFVDGKVVVYHGKEYDAMTNEPDMTIQLAFEYFGYQPNGTVTTIDRRMRARHYLRDMHERGVDSTPRALLAMRGLLASVWAGTEEIDRTSNNEVYPTIWGVLADQVNKRYYLNRVYTMCTEVYDFTMFDASRPEVVALPMPGCRYPDIEIKGVL